MNKLNKIIEESRRAYKEIKPDINKCSDKRWLGKNVEKFEIIHSFDNLENLKLNGIGCLELSDELGQTLVRLSTNTDIQDMRPRPSSSVQILLENKDFSEYNRFSVWVYPKTEGLQNFYTHFTIFNEGDKGKSHAPSLHPNTWNHIVWEVDHLKRDRIVKIGITPFLMGCPDDAIGDVKFFFKDLQIQKVDVDYSLGWDLGERIAYSHSGYFKNSKKQALTQQAINNKFHLFDENGKLVYTKIINMEKTDKGDFYKLDFTDFNQEGYFYLQIDNRKTSIFEISDNPYKTSIWKSLNFLRMLRCGEDVSGVHSPCHLNSYALHPDGRMVPTFGGWHDAGDVSQFEICTAEIAQSLLELAIANKGDIILYERLLEEARYGLNWLLRTRFNDGYRALAVHYSIWRKSLVKGCEHFSNENPIYANNMAENGPFENFLASIPEAIAARIFEEEDPVFASWCYRVAIEDFEFGLEGYKKGIYTKRWGSPADSQVCGALVLAASELYITTKDERYLNEAVNYANIIMATQQKDYPDWEKPIRGFFYEDIEHTKLLTYEHRGHEQTPIQALVRLCEIAKDHANYELWMESINLYQEYVVSTISYTAPYNLLCAHVYRYDQLNFDRFTIPKTITEEEYTSSFKRQIQKGIKLDKKVYLRIFPISIHRRGFHATLLSKTKALSSIGKLLNDDNLKQIAVNQLEWVLGNNPFSTSTMYGEGDNFHPLYVAFSRQIVGSLPVGFKTFNDLDLPYWPQLNESVYKEIWGHTTSKFLFVLADL